MPCVSGSLAIQAKKKEYALALFKFWKRKPSPEVRTAAAQEVKDLEMTFERVYRPNLQVLLGDATNLSEIVVTDGYDFQGFNDMFLKGIVSAFIEGRPELPTDSITRSIIYMGGLIANREEISLADGIDRAKLADQRYNDSQPIFDAFYDAGRLAFRENNEAILFETSLRVRSYLYRLSTSE